MVRIPIPFYLENRPLGPDWFEWWWYLWGNVRDSWTDGAICPVDIGANASAEEAEEAHEDQATKVNNIVHSFRYQSTSFDKKQYMSYLKGTSTHLSLFPHTESAPCVDAATEKLLRM